MKSPASSPLPSDRLLSVVPTRKRRKGLYYCVQINRTTAKQFGVSKWIVAAFEHPAISKNPRLKERELPFTAVHGWVDVREDIPDGVAAVDQTIRNALGMPVPVFPDLKDLKIALFPARRSLWHRIRTWCAGLFGIRYMALRAKAADVADMEKSYVRIPGAALRSLGVLEADDVIVERPFAIFEGDIVRSFHISYLRISAFLANDNMLEYRHSMERLFPRRYFNGALALYDTFSSRLACSMKGRNRGCPVAQPVWLSRIFLPSSWILTPALGMWTNFLVTLGLMASLPFSPGAA